MSDALRLTDVRQAPTPGAPGEVVAMAPGLSVGAPARPNPVEGPAP